MTTALEFRTDALAALGTDVSRSGTAQQALIDSGIAGMDVRKVPVQTATGKTIPHRYALVDATGEPLPNMVVGEDFTVVQYDDVAATLDAVSRRTGATFDRAGVLDVRAYGIGGARAFVSMRLPEQLRIGGGDLIDAYLVAFMSHGWNSNILTPTATRVECANQQPQIARDEKFKIVIRHTASAPARTLAAEQALVASVQSMAQATGEAEALLRIKTTNDQFRAIIERLYPKGGDSKQAETRFQNRIEKLEMLRTGHANRDIAGTAWGDYQAILEYGEWHQNVKGGDDENTNLAAVRARRALTAPNLVKAQLKAFEVVRETVGI